MIQKTVTIVLLQNVLTSSYKIAEQFVKKSCKNEAKEKLIRTQAGGWFYI